MNLREEQVDVWCVPLDLDEASLLSLQRLLSEDELVRAERFRVEKPKERFIAGRGYLRTILSRYLNEKPEDLRFEYTRYGKPFLKGKPGPKGISRICFNLSHSGDLALYGVSRGREIGVDVEKIRTDWDFMKMAERFFSPSEVHALKSLPEDQRILGFFNCWTRKEAYFKAKQGLPSSAPGRFEVSLAPGEPAALLSHREEPGEVDRWYLEDLDVGPGYVGAVAVEGREVEVIFRKIELNSIP